MQCTGVCGLYQHAFVHMCVCVSGACGYEDTLHALLKGTPGPVAPDSPAWEEAEVHTDTHTHTHKWLPLYLSSLFSAAHNGCVAREDMHKTHACVGHILHCSLLCVCVCLRPCALTICLLHGSVLTYPWLSSTSVTLPDWNRRYRHWSTIWACAR